MVHLPPEDLVDGGALLERALGHHLGPHLLQHQPGQHRHLPPRYITFMYSIKALSGFLI